MTDDKPLLAKEFDDPVHAHTKAVLLARLEKLMQYDAADTGDLAFERNFRDCQNLYAELERADRKICEN